MYFIGLDLGQKRDHTALAIVERIENRRAFMGTTFERLVVRYVERMPLGMPYPRIVERVRDVVRCSSINCSCSLAVDATGVGAPVVDMLRAAQIGCSISAVTITGGEHASGDSVPKRDLMAEMLLLLENRQLTIGKLTEGPRLIRELCDVRSHANGRVGADGSGEHDDLVIALALACWRAKGRQYVGERSERLF